MHILLGTVFVASLLGSLHCVGMCGPFALLAGANSDRRNAAIAPTIAYSFGRLITYSTVGFVFGILGMALNKGASFTSWQQSATFVAGVSMIAVGLIALARCCGLKIKLPSALGPMQKVLQAGFNRATNMQTIPKAIAIGALTSLMPCGWLYTFAITAAGTGSPTMGMAVMATFWSGTVPIMTALMLGVNQFGQRFQKNLPVIMATLVIAIGGFTIAFRAPVVVGKEGQVVSGFGSLTEQVNNIEHDNLPCCRKNTISDGALIEPEFVNLGNHNP